MSPVLILSTSVIGVQDMFFFLLYQLEKVLVKKQTVNLYAENVHKEYKCL